MKRAVSYLLALTAFASGAPSFAQLAQPPVKQSVSPLGLSYLSMQFRLDEEDLSIGGEGQAGLVLRRSFMDELNANPGIFYQSLGWTDSFATYVTNAPVPDPPGTEEPTPDYQKQWVYRFSIGTKTYAFFGGTTGGTSRAPSHVPWGNYYNVQPNGASVIYTGTTSGYYTLTEADGTVTIFTPGVGAAKVASIQYPDGTRLDFTYVNARLKSVFSTRGWAILIDAPSRACAVNLSRTSVGPTDTCPAGVPTVDYGYTSGTFRPAVQLLTSVTKGGGSATYSYSAQDHITCVRDPGQTICKVINTYGSCPAIWGDPNYTAADRNLKEPIVQQQSGTGETYAYTGRPACRDDNLPDTYWTGNTVTTTKGNGSIETVTVDSGGTPSSMTDGLGYTQTFETSADSQAVDVSQVNAGVDAEGGRTDWSRDARGNITQIVRHAKPGSGLADQTTSATYASTCSNTKTCNKPISTTDARGAVTNFTYDPTHGGLVVEEAPAVDGIRAVRRLGYIQGYAWLKSPGGGYAAATSPVWLLSEERTCRTTATVNGGCAGGAADEVVTSYQYQSGNSSTPSNLLLIGKAVSADGQTRRTCFGYDYSGNRISETKPRAGLTVCP